MGITLSDYIKSVLEIFNKEKRNIEEVSFDVGIDSCGIVKENSLNRLKFTVKTKPEIVSDKKEELHAK